jgi:hypothetical protein
VEALIKWLAERMISNADEMWTKLLSLFLLAGLDSLSTLCGYLYFLFHYASVEWKKEREVLGRPGKTILPIKYQSLATQLRGCD